MRRAYFVQTKEKSTKKRGRTLYIKADVISMKIHDITCEYHAESSKYSKEKKQ